MAQIGISEFTFGFGFLAEQTSRHWGNLRIAPILPSLQQEQHEGWDAHLPLVATDYYYQFKLSDYLERSNSKYISDGTYSSSYYRIALHRRNQNQQHTRLKIHAANNPETYYVAPEFHSLADFNSAFLGQQLLHRSRLIPLRDCKNIHDGDQHYITFQDGSARWKFHSVPEAHDSSIQGAKLLDHYEKSSGRFRELNNEFASELFSRAAQTARVALKEEGLSVSELRRTKSGLSDKNDRIDDIELLQFNPNNHNRNVVLKRTSQVLSVFFGLTLVLVGRGSQ